MKTEADEAAFAHWYEAAQTAQRALGEVRRERDSAEEAARALRESLTELHSQRDEALRALDVERREKTRRFALRRELEDALGVGDSYADGALDAALARIAVLRTVEAERDRLRTELHEALAGREREYARAEAEHDAAARIASEWAAQDPWRAVDPCPLCWGPKLLAEADCKACDESRQMPGDAT